MNAITPLAERFWPKVDKASGENSCWLWKACRVPKGYGKVSIATSVSRYAHIVAWELTKGEIPFGKCVLHSCDNPPCVNPAHLFLGTRADNNADMLAKGRHARGERQGHAKLSAADVLAIRASSEMQANLARRYRVCDATISMIIAGKRWRHI